MDVECRIVQDMLKGDDCYELRMKLKVRNCVFASLPRADDLGALYKCYRCSVQIVQSIFLALSRSTRTRPSLTARMTEVWGNPQVEIM